MTESPKSPDPPTNRPSKFKGGAAVRKAIDALMRLSGTKITTPEHIDAYFKEISGIGTDRGIGIIMVTTVEDALQDAIESRLSIEDGQRQLLFGPDGAIGEFASKIRVGRALKIFGPETFQNLELLRAIRNTFAHSKISLDFETPDVKTACDLLDMPLIRTLSDGIQPVWSVQILGYKGRSRFQMVCHTLAQNFASYARLSNERPPPDRPDNRYETVVRPKPLH
jgi:hypothetical protein